MTDRQTWLCFLNLYCYLCNLQNTSMVDISDKLKPWDLEIRCRSYLNIHNYLLVSDFLKTIMRYADCNIAYQPNTIGRSTVLPCKVESYIQSLNKMGLRKPNTRISASLEPRYASNRTLANNSYKNQFCAVCNPSTTSMNAMLQVTWFPTTPVMR